MNLTEFLKYYKANKTEVFGDFIRSRRTELGISARQLAIRLNISAVYMTDIERNQRPAPITLLNDIIEELQIDDSEQDAFYDLAELSHQNWPEITEFITKRPEARKFLKLASSVNLSDEVFKKLSYLVEKEKTKTMEDNEELEK